MTLATGIYVRSQARSTRTLLQETKAARTAAQDQANSARESASSAFKSAEASIWQAKSAQAQLALARASYDQADAPEFSIKAEPPVNGIVRVTITMLKGVPGIYVSAGWSAESAYVSSGRRELVTHSHGDPLCPQTMFLDGSIVVDVDVPDDPEHYQHGSVALALHCEEINGERTWPYAKVAHWSVPKPTKSD